MPFGEGTYANNFGGVDQWAYARDFVVGEQGIRDAFGGRVDTRNMRRQQTNNALRAGVAKAFGIEAEENRRFGEQSEFLTGEFDRANADFADSERTLASLFSSRAADAAGAEAKAGLRNVRQMIGARGIDPNSGLAAGLASQVASRQQEQLIGAHRNIALDGARRRRDERIRRMQSAGALADFRNQSPSMVALDALGSVANINIGREQMEEQKKAAKDAKKSAITGGLLSGLGSGLSALMGGM